MTSPFLGTSVNVCASIRVPVCYRDGDCGLGRLCGVKGSYGPGGMSERRSIAGLSDRSKTNRNGAIEIDDPLGKLVIRRTPGPQPATLIVGHPYSVSSPEAPWRPCPARASLGRDDTIYFARTAVNARAERRCARYVPVS
jgi:hypothetical protein